MLVGFATLITDPLGGFAVEVDHSKSKVDNRVRRVSRVATLDGGSAVLDSGYSDTDRTISLDVSGASEFEVTRLMYLFENYDRVLLFLPDGAYMASPEAINRNSGRLSISFLISGQGALNA